MSTPELALNHVHPFAVREVIRLLAPQAIKEPLIRIGSIGDGGYLIPTTRLNVSDVFSPGVADVCDFEWHFAELGAKCHLCDLSVDSPPRSHPLFYFTKKFLGPFTTHSHLSLEEWISMSPKGDGDWILQMDIEGAEYSTLLPCPDALLRRFSIVVVEFHAFNEVFSPTSFPLISMAISKLSRNFTPIHAHANNAAPHFLVGDINFPTCFEMTFARRDVIEQTGKYAELPHELDAPNSTENPDNSLSLEKFFIR